MTSSPTPAVLPDARALHPLTPLIEGRYKIYVELEPPPYRRSRYLKPQWRARDQQWAVQDHGCPQFLAANPGGLDPFRIWNTAEYREWEAQR